MRVEQATLDDLKAWLELAAEVEYLFGPMVDDPKFIQVLEKNISLNRAYCIREKDGLPGSPLLGAMLFNTAHAPTFKIGWLAVSSQAKKTGVATALMDHVMQLISPPAEVTVITFGEDIPDGQPARRLYQKFGFLPIDEPIPNGPEGGSRQKFQLTVE
ncbi:GNAT family N-acetyltransferase [Paenibacillus sp. N1-5-1-14]|uniref:GNAT family N-acetyltransferase n=1 Tax=Paenibacillus radicibacter TaxID=2972488 RepID=UPI0021590900|nr:GNAT family N-acetyltransferase [Paenibacillus radicibacter]MCR8645544.1 GNAT family N-acetyltransferase [Paenibacillus radicibacter]